MSKMYAMLMERKAYREDFYIFKPIEKIEGELREYEGFNIFETGCANAYYMADDIMTVDSDYPYVVFNIIDEDTLLKKYCTEDLTEALALYVNEELEKIYFGLCTYDSDKLEMREMDNDDLISKLFCENVKTYNDAMYESEHSSDLTIEVSLEDDIFNEYISSEYLKEAFDNACNSVKITADYDEIIDLLENIDDFYLSLATKFEREEPKELRMIFLKMAEVFRKLKAFDEIDEIKLKFFSVHDELKAANDSVIKIYKEYENKNKSTSLSVVEETKKDVKIDVREIKKKFDEIVIGQEEAKKDIIQAVFMNTLMDDPANKNNCLLVGPTGSGKTLIAECVSKYFDMPIEIIDTTQLTSPGYVGADIEDFLARLLATTKGDLKKAEEGIVVFDELDKKGSASNSDISGRAVLNTLLPFIGGTKYDITYNNKKYQFDTSKLTIFATGAFASAQEDMKTKTIGFGADNEINEDIKYKEFTTDDFVKKANMPAELIGRFSVISQLSGHTIDSLKKILTESSSSALLSEKKKLKLVDVELLWNQEFLDEAARKAIKLKTGARSLKSIVENSIKEARWEVLCNLDTYKKIILTDKSVNDNLDVILVDKKNKKHNLKDIVDAKDKTSLSIPKKLVYNK